MKRVILALAALLCAGTALAQPYKGDFIDGVTITHTYATGDNTTGADEERTVAGTPSCIKDGGTTELTTGVTDSGLSEFDGVVGMNKMTVDTTQTGFDPGSDFECWVRGSTLNGVTVSYPVFSFSIENRVPLKGAIIARFTADTGSTTTQIELDGNVITLDSQYVGNTVWDITASPNWESAIQGSNAAGDYLTINPGAPSAPADNDVLLVMRAVVMPTFNPATQTVNVGSFAGTTCTAKCGENINASFNNGGSSIGSNAQIGNIGANAESAVTNIGTLSDFGSGATIAANIKDASGMMAFGTCDAMSTTTTCRNASLTQADNYWNNWTMIIVAGQPARCIRSFTASTDQLGWPQALPSTAASQKFVLLAAPECRNAP